MTAGRRVPGRVPRSTVAKRIAGKLIDRFANRVAARIADHLAERSHAPIETAQRIARTARRMSDTAPANFAIPEPDSFRRVRDKLGRNGSHQASDSHDARDRRHGGLAEHQPEPRLGENSERTLEDPVQVVWVRNTGVFQPGNLRRRARAR